MNRTQDSGQACRSIAPYTLQDWHVNDKRYIEKIKQYINKWERERESQEKNCKSTPYQVLLVSSHHREKRFAYKPFQASLFQQSKHLLNKQDQQPLAYFEHVSTSLLYCANVCFNAHKMQVSGLLCLGLQFDVLINFSRVHLHAKGTALSVYPIINKYFKANQKK